MARGWFAKYDAVTAAGPVARNHFHLKAGGGELCMPVEEAAATLLEMGMREICSARCSIVER